MSFRNTLAAAAACVAAGACMAAPLPETVIVTSIDLAAVTGDLQKVDAALLDLPGTAALRLVCTTDAVSRPLQGAPKVHPCEGLRQVSQAGDRVRVLHLYVKEGECVVDPKNVVKVGFEEKPRGTLLAEGLKSVFAFIGGKAGITATAAMGEKPQRRWCTEEHVHVLTGQRATLTISAQYGEAKDAAVSTRMITGPEEHWFLSGDALVSGAKEVRWDEATKRLVAKDKPNQLYLGFNYMLGDLYGRHDRMDLRNRTVLKLMISPTRKPFDNIGLGVGYRFADGGLFAAPPAEGSATDSGGFMVFAGVFWTRRDSVDGAGAVLPGGRERSVRVGVSYSLDTLMGWLK